MSLTSLVGLVVAAEEKSAEVAIGGGGDPPCVTSPVSLRVALPPWRARSSRGCGVLCRTKWLCKHQAPADVIGCHGNH